MVKTTVRQTVPLQPVEVHSRADTHLQPMDDPMLEQTDVPRGGCDPVGSLHCSRLLAGPVDPWREEPTLEQAPSSACDTIGEPILKQSVPEGLHPMEGTHTGATCEELQLVERTHVGKVSQGLCSVGATPHWSRGRG